MSWWNIFLSPLSTPPIPPPKNKMKQQQQQQKARQNKTSKENSLLGASYHYGSAGQVTVCHANMLYKSLGYSASFPNSYLERQDKIPSIWSIKALLLMQKIKLELQAPGFSLAQLWILRYLESEPADGIYSFFFSLYSSFSLSASLPPITFLLNKPKLQNKQTKSFAGKNSSSRLL